MSYWETEAVQKRIRTRYANRAGYLASVLSSILLALLAFSDTNTWVWGVMIFLLPIAHTAYLLYFELSERAIDQEMRKREPQSNELEDRDYWRLTDDGEVSEYDSDGDEKPKRRQSTQE